MTTDGSAEHERPLDGGADADGAHQVAAGGHGAGAHQGPGRWARRGAAGIGLPPGESVHPEEGVDSPPTADSGDPDISPSLAGGHAGASRHDGD